MNGGGGTEHVAWQSILDAPSGLSAEMEAHCERCPECRTLVQAATTLLGLFERARLPQVPEALATATLIRVLGASSDRPAPDLSVWDRLLAGLQDGLDELTARLTGDSLIPSAAARGGQGAAARTMLYETDSYSISLALERRESTTAATLRGQLIPLLDEELPERRRAILHTPKSLLESELDALGGFCFADVPDDELRLAIVVGNRFVRIAPLPLGREGGAPID